MSKTIIGSPVSPTKVAFRSDSNKSDRGFNLTYSYSPCGGVFRGPRNVITTPRASYTSSDYPANVDCVWLFKFNEGEQIEVEK